MNDVFFLALREIQYSEIADVVRRLTSFDACYTELGLSVYRPGGELVMSVGRMEESDLSSEDKQALRDRKVKSVFYLSHHTSEVRDVLIPVATVLLEEFGGWIGDDDDEFEPRLGLDQLSSLAGEEPGR